MKVAYNACFGGFSLSKLACEKLTKIKGRVINCYDFNDDKYRADKDLIDVIESLGDKASGPCAYLQIKEIPCGAEFEIDEYDGSESVMPPRQSW